MSNSGKEKKDQEPRRLVGSKLLMPVNLSRGVGVVNELISTVRKLFATLVLILYVLLPPPLPLIFLFVTP